MFNYGVTGKIILDSVQDDGIRLTTIHLRYPRMIHSELMTHRVFSRNGRSSRAVPVLRLLEEDHYTPLFKANKAGMVATEDLPYNDLEEATAIWDELAEFTKKCVKRLSELKVHKQWANRPLEAFGYIDVLISSTDWANFMALRDEEGAQPEIRAVAQVIKELMDASTPTALKLNQWHLPYIEEKDYDEVARHIADASAFQDDWTPSGETVLDTIKKVSVARCARLTIKPFDGDASIEKELNRYSLLMESRPVHASPAEHIATPDKRLVTLTSKLEKGKVVGVREEDWMHPDQHGNFYGWRQYRKMIPYNTIEDER